ncbi:hypothetical protein AVEN_44171-1 [Araneus ventricosus]|uniref:Reverse transcriptase domain-containing protein n=1 Tax=Araneus ventricosus TaxID=182803 RepID=A0A4Y2UBT3_ARAVE|nr:hypothetical protein AVEN_197396-1 [Araneus ventricosus]GBO10494.1 hypothetical protein AVEN_243085-1 [Araneus ventricosus]GBO10503.1 hypothetical protein AVEN_266046-1 [Araneus ventricosus]GBO10517.1 hypothetical protein AVEN_44171-1 [Araneus ventricosus]
MWDNVRRVYSIYPEKHISCLQKNGQEVRNISEMVDVLAEAFASICSASNYTEPFLVHKNCTERIKLRFQATKHLSYNTDLTIFELHTALSVIKHTSPGPDEVTYSMLQHLSEHSLLNILYMFNCIWKEHVFPDCWKHTFIIPIPKPGKDPQDPLNYRPIALTSCMCKLFERIVNVRLVHILEKNEYISPFQAINPILSVIPQTVQKNLYVDDLHISCYARNMQLIERRRQTAINNIVECSNKSGFTISAQKTIIIHFCKRPLHPDPELFLSGVPIRFQDNYKFLGLVFDKHLTFLLHIASFRKRCLRSLNILRTLSNTSWGADHSCLLRV